MKLEILYVTERKRWRKWLLENFKTKSEIWLTYPKKSTGKKRIEYNTAVEEALCFGWIDSTVKSLDQNHTIQKFTVRRKNSHFSQPNKERLKWVFKNGIIHPSIKENIKLILDKTYHFPSDIIDEIKKDNVAWKNYQPLSNSYKRIRVAYINSARKKPEEFKKRLNNFIKKTHENKMIRGFGGIDKYY